MVNKPKALFLSGCDFAKYPTGGTLSFAKHMIKAFGNRLALVGITTDETPVGQWIKKEIDGICYDFFSIGKRNCNSARKSIVPSSLRGYCAFKQHKKAILSIGIRSAFAGCGLSFVAVRNWPWDTLCGIIHGMRNPFERPRYWYGRMAARPWNHLRISAMNRADAVFIAADDTEIDEFFSRTKNMVDRKRLIHYGTRVDTDVFRPAAKDRSRERLGWEPQSLTIVALGRISWVKGWDLILDTFRYLLNKHPRSRLLYVGDGEDSPMLRSKIIEHGLSDHVSLTGFVPPTLVASYLNAADVFVMASHWEGWPTALVEALACGKPVVSSDICAASTLVVEGQNGYVVKNRHPAAFAEAIEKATELKFAAEISLKLSEQYALKHLARDISRHWSVLAD